MRIFCDFISSAKLLNLSNSRNDSQDSFSANANLIFESSGNDEKCFGKCIKDNFFVLNSLRIF